MNKVKSLDTNKPVVRYVIISLTAFFILIFVIYFLYFQPFSNTSTGCMGTDNGDNLLNYILIIGTLLLLSYAAMRLIKGRPTNSFTNSPIQKMTGRGSEEISYNQLSTSNPSKAVQDNVNDISDVSNTSNTATDKNSNGKIGIIKKLLKEDEVKVMEIIIENEGVTQDSLRFKTDFSYSKISMIIKKLEERDLIVRERFGKTYKVYTSGWVKSQDL